MIITLVACSFAAPFAFAEPILAPDAPEFFDYLFTDMDGNPDRIYQTGQQIQFVKNIENNENYTLTGNLELNLDESHLDFHEMIFDYEFSIHVGEDGVPFTFWTPKQPGFYKLSITSSYDDPVKGDTIHEEMWDHFTVVDKFSKAFDPDDLNCRLNFYPVVKPDYSTVLCVSDDTKDVLKERGWSLISFSRTIGS